MKYTRAELLAQPKREWDKALTGVAGVYVIPSGRKHDSGWACMDFVAEFKDRRTHLMRFGGCCDDVRFKGAHFRMDCEYPSRIIHIWNPYPFTISHNLSSIDFIENI